MTRRVWKWFLRVAPFVAILGALVAETLSFFTPIIDLNQGQQIILALIAVLAVEALAERVTLLQEIQERVEVLGNKTAACFLRERRFLADLYNEEGAKAKEVDVIALSMEGLLSHYAQADLIRWVADEGKRIRVLVLSPTALATVVRGSQIKRLHVLYSRAMEQLKTYDGQCKGSFEVRSHDDIPYFAYFRADEEIILGLYYVHIDGLESEALRVSRTERLVHEKLRDHFEALWIGKTGSEVPLEDRVICRISGSGGRFSFPESAGG
jgi:hypothetical protein